MKQLQTHLQKEDTTPSEVIFETIKHNRGLLTSTKELAKFRRIIAGKEGERIVLEYLEKYGENHWVIVQNLWLNHFGPFECDLILITRFKIYIFEIKNYYGAFSYKNGIVKIDNKQRNINPIHQARRNYNNVKEILTQIFPGLAVEGALIFTGIDNAVLIESEIPDIEIIPRNHLMNYIKQIVQEERTYHNPKADPLDILAHLENFEIQNDFAPAPISDEQMATAKKGIYCEQCKNYQIKIKRFEITCPCGHAESREQATLRTIYDYAILNFGTGLTRKELLDFFNGQLSKTYLVNILNKHFTPVKKSSSTFYTLDDLTYKN